MVTSPLALSSEWTPRTEAERRALDAWLTGEKADLTHLAAGDPDRIIRGPFLALLLRGRMGDLDPNVLDTDFVLDGAKIEGPVQISRAIIGRDLDFRRCIFADGLTATGAQICGFKLDESQIDGTLYLDDAHISGGFGASGARFDALGAGDAINAQGVRAADWFMDSTDEKRTEVLGCLFMHGAELSGQFRAKGARFDSGATANAIVAQGVRAADWFMDSSEAYKTEVKGCLFIPGAVLSGQFRAKGVRFDANGATNAVQLQRAQIAGGLFLRPGGAHSTEILGNLSLDSAAIENGIFVRDARFSGAGLTIDLESATVEGLIDFYADLVEGRFHAPNLKVTGRVVLSANFQGRVDLSGAWLRDLYLPGASFKDHNGQSNVLNGGCPAAGLDLSRAHIGVLHDRCASWEKKEGTRGEIVLRGLTYDRLENPFGGKNGAGDRNWKNRLDWLSCQPDHDLGDDFNPQPWRQLALTYRKMGLDSEARRITIDRRTRYRRSKGCSDLETAWLCLLDWTGEYGFNPRRTFMVGLFLILASWGVFASVSSGCVEAGCYDGARFIPVEGAEVRTTENERPIVDDQNFDRSVYPSFDALLYSLDLFVPLVEFGITDLWAINDGYEAEVGAPWTLRVGFLLQWYGVLLRLIGAFLSAYLIVGLSGLMIRDEIS